MQTTNICLKSGENKITEYRNATGTISKEEIEISKYIRDTLDWRKEEIRCKHIDDAVDSYLYSNKRIAVDRKRALTFKEILYNFICSFDWGDVILLLTLIGVWIAYGVSRMKMF